MKNKRIHLITIFCFGLLVGSCYHLASAKAQSLDAPNLQEILSINDSARTHIDYTGIVKIESCFERMPTLKFRIWMKGNEFYRQVPEFSKREQDMKKEEPRRSDHHTHEFCHVKVFRKGSAEYSLLPNKKYIELLLQNYSVELQDGGEIAQRQTNQLNIIPKNLPRFGMRIWLDQENYLILKREIAFLSAEQERLALRMQFENIKYNVQPPDSVVRMSKQKESRGFRHTQQLNKKSFSDLKELKDQANMPIFAPQHVPKGCQLVSIKYAQEKNRTVMQLHYTDGLLSLSIFQFKGQPPHSIQRMLDRQHSSRCHPLAFRQLIADKKDDHYFLLIGNFPSKQLKKIADSLTAYN